MFCLVKRLFFATTILLLLTTFSHAKGLAIAPETCLQCHDDVVSKADYAGSVHGQNACTSCHVEVTDLDEHTAGEVIPGRTQCVRCHKTESAEHYASVHMLNDVRCADCHTDIHSRKKWAGEKTKIIETCSQCHDTENYQASVHGTAVAAGSMDSAVCSDCHGLHKIDGLGNTESFTYWEFHTRACLNCHSNSEMMARNGVNNLAVKTYLESYHGKNYHLGFPEKVAGCSDCHTSHAVFPASDSRSSVNDANLVKTCGNCHTNATSLFAQYYPHGDHSDSENYPVLYWTFMGMTGLLLGTFAVFWIHTLLWMFRGFVENREIRAALHEGRAEHHIPEGHKQYLRFQKRHIILHLTVIVSFLGLSLTGLPMKFADQRWAEVMMSFFGGPHLAGLIHRACAILTFYYFVGAMLLSFDFLFLRKDIKGIWLQRLFGPDSLMPNFRDLRDIGGMVRWFLFKGPKPTFDRWTYWEKFDFLAVFWGMFAIGGSGLMLWFPEFFGLFLPGWAFNVATIIHSDEALLATGFIFTVHFFNTHGRPEKFPMDFVIFNGQISKEEFIHERGDQWKRYEEEGITENYVADKTSGVLYDFLFKGFGFAALFTGIACLVLMFYAFLS